MQMAPDWFKTIEFQMYFRKQKDFVLKLLEKMEGWNTGSHRQESSLTNYRSLLGMLQIMTSFELQHKFLF